MGWTKHDLWKEREDFAYLRISHHSAPWKIQAISIFSHLFNAGGMACADKMSHFFLRCYYTQSEHEVPIGCSKSFLKSKIKSDYTYWKCLYAWQLLLSNTSLSTQRLVKERKASSEVLRVNSVEAANTSQFPNCNIYLAAMGQLINQKSEMETGKYFLVQRFL